MKILLIEDSSRLRKSVGLALRNTGYAVDTASDGKEGWWQAEGGTYDVIVLDLMLPGMDGLTLLRKLRSKGIDTHVLILTAKDAVENRVEGLEAGADDYLTKPFSIDELLARVAVLVRRNYGKKSAALPIGNLQLDLIRREASVAGEPLTLSPREFRLLEFLCLRDGALVSRPEIESRLYDESAEIFSNVVDSTISCLRKKMLHSGCEPRIVTRRGLGYILENDAS